MKTAGQKTITQEKLFRILSLAVLIVMFGTSCRQTAQAQAPGAPTASVYTNAEEFSVEQGINALEPFHQDVHDILAARRFEDLDRMAQKLRTTKARWPGSRWKLEDFYDGVSSPRDGVNRTVEDWAEHLNLVNEWVNAKPQSITARVALAESYQGYAWHARGDGYSNKVSESGWKLFGERIGKAQEILMDAKKLNEKCPEWYAAMLEVAKVEGWPKQQASALLEEAIAFDPMYYNNYHAFATYLQPKWNGEPGDTEKFSEAAANRMGGAEGDVLYFQLAFSQRCGCPDESIFKAMSWERVKRGYAASEKLYGKSLMRINQIAYMAIKRQDVLAADDAFKRMGDRWSEPIWSNRQFYEQWRDWVAQMAPGERYIANVKLEAKQNMETAEGQRYRDEVAKRFAGYAKECAAKVPAPLPTLHLMFVVKADGTPAGMTVEPDTPFGNCMRTISYDHRTEKFSAAPKDAYWVTWEIDPKRVQ